MKSDLEESFSSGKRFWASLLLLDWGNLISSSCFWGRRDLGIFEWKRRKRKMKKLGEER